MTWVKICGMTNLDDALVAVDAGADAVGFVFYEKSPRKIDVETAREIVKKLPERVEKVGVFVDADCGRIREIVSAVGISIVQLHGGRSTEDLLSDATPAVERVGVSRVIFMVPGEMLTKAVANEAGVLIRGRTTEKAFAVLLDSRSGELCGGTGTTFDWEEAQRLAIGMSFHVPLVIAGGLTSANVTKAVRVFQPFGVDVVSGVELRPGKKDPEKVRAFVQAVREMDRKTS